MKSLPGLYGQSMLVGSLKRGPQEHSTDDFRKKASHVVSRTVLLQVLGGIHFFRYTRRSRLSTY
jgi:hypothetical protein